LRFQKIKELQSFFFYTLAVKGFLELLAQVDEEQHQEVLVSTPKFKGSREVKNLECLINLMLGVLVLAGAKARVPLL